MLAHDRGRRFYWSWENNREIPPARRENMRDDPRIAGKIAEVDAALKDGLLDHRQHVELGDQPSECIMLLAQDFKSYLWLVQTQVPRYREWLLHEADLDAAYVYHRRALQVMQSEAPGKWTLKLPNHARAIDAILRVYPDARIVVTHRDPAKVVGSCCDAERFFLAQGNTRLDLHALGTQTLEFLSVGMDRVAAAQARHPHVPFHDFHFRRFIADPIGELRRLYAFLGDELGTETEGAMRDELKLAERLRQEVGAHRYGLENFGLSVEGVRERFANYITRYGVELEGGAGRPP